MARHVKGAIQNNIRLANADEIQIKLIMPSFGGIIFSNLHYIHPNLSQRCLICCILLISSGGNLIQKLLIGRHLKKAGNQAI
jgi:hypothetical protein